MAERTNTRVETSEARRDVEHGVTITSAPEDPQKWQASCRCGWHSAEVENVTRAAAAYEHHALPPPAPIECQSWCILQTGHPGEFCREDQRCESEILTVPLTLDNGYVSNGMEFNPQTAWVYASQQADAPQPAITVCLEDERGITLTPAEAQQLDEKLRLALVQVALQVAR